jgi:ketol-acid reductoisomerase
MRGVMLYDADLDDRLAGQRVAVLGFGPQGRAQALNLRDSGVAVVVGLRAGSRAEPAVRAAGLEARPIARAVAEADLVALLIPDAAQPAVYADEVAPNLRPGGALVFAHGYAVHYGHLRARADLDVVLVAPLGVGDQVRAQFVAGAGVPALVAVQQDASGAARARALGYAQALGAGRAGVLESSFREETESDLFAEQAVLCGGLTHLVTAAFETLTESGYSPEVAYFSCLHEVKLLADLMHARGIAGMRESISQTAAHGELTRGPRVIGAESRAAMRAMLDEVRSGAYDRELQAELAAGAPALAAGRAAARAHLIEQVGARLRAGMPWLQKGPGTSG